MSGSDTPTSAAGDRQLPKGPARVLIVERQPLFLCALADVLQRAWPEVELTLALDYVEAMERFVRGSTCVALVNAESRTTPDDSELQQLIRALLPAPVLVTSSRVNRDDVSAAIAAGARGFLTKTITPEALCGAILFTIGGGACFPNEVVQAVSAGHTLSLAATGRAKSRREMEILALLERGSSNKTIARDMKISLATVKAHVQSILRNTSARNRVEAVLNARRMGLLPLAL